jgi:hypothetical protein
MTIKREKANSEDYAHSEVYAREKSSRMRSE